MTFFVLVVMIAGTPTPFYFDSGVEACKAYHTTFQAAQYKAVWRYKDESTGWGKKKMACQAPQVVTPPAPPSYTDYPSVEE